MPAVTKLDAGFFMDEVKNRVNALLAEVTDSFLNEGDNGTVTVQIKLKQEDDKGNISAHVEVNSKNAKFNSLSYTCHKNKRSLESGQIKMTEEDFSKKKAS